MPAESSPRLDQATARAVALVAVLSLVLAAGWWWQGRSRQTETIPRRTADAAATTGAALPESTLTAVPAADVATGRSPAAAVPPPGTNTGPVAGTARGGPSALSAGTITVDVRGAVRRRGVRALAAGSRVLDAVEAAGGLRRGRGYGPINLARPLVDGEQIVVGRSSPSAAPADQGGTAAAGTVPVDLNSADAGQLEQLDGVGPVIAARIVQWRQDNGRFASVDDLLDVTGIGEKTLASLRDGVTVG